MSFISHPFLQPLKRILRPLVHRYSSYFGPPPEARFAVPEAQPAAPEAPSQDPARTTNNTEAPVAAEPKLDVSHLLHHCRSALLREMPPAAQTICSAGCAGGWYFEWFERCYGTVANHIGIEYY